VAGGPRGRRLRWRHEGVGNTDGIVRFPYTPGTTRITAAPVKVVDLPGGVAEHGIDKEEGRAAIWEIDLRNGSHRVFASGLRNPVGMVWEPELRRLWVAVNEREELGNDLVPNYMTAVKENGFYCWPYSYYGGHVDDRRRRPS